MTRRSPPGSDRARRALSVAAIAVYVATPIELWLTEHTEETIQWLPFVAAGVGLLCHGVARWARGIPHVLLGGLLALVAAIGLFGMWEHLEHNLEFVREIKPNLGGGDAMIEALFGAGPALAPGILVLGAFLSWSAIRAEPTEATHQR